MEYDPFYKSILLPKEFLDNANALLNKKPLDYYVRVFLGFFEPPKDLFMKIRTRTVVSYITTVWSEFFWISLYKHI